MTTFVLEAITRTMPPGDYAVLAEVSERWTAPIDTRMRALGATVIREQRSDVVDDLIARRTDAHRAAVERWKAERAARKVERAEAKLEDGLGNARELLQRVAERAQERLDDTRRELHQKLCALDRQASMATPEARQQIEQHIAEIRRDFGERERRLSHAFEVAQQALQPSERTPC
jgi:aminopeptidase N